jgi:hypothetical protein
MHISLLGSIVNSKVMDSKESAWIEVLKVTAQFQLVELVKSLVVI